MTKEYKEHEDLMNVTIYDALISANVEEGKARKAAIEMGRNDLRLVAVLHAVDRLRAHMDTSTARSALYLGISFSFSLIGIMGVLVTLILQTL